MKNIIFIFFCFPSAIFGQFCDSLLLQTITNPGPFLVSQITENQGIRNGSDYNGSTIYYPTSNGSLTLPSIVLVPGFMNTELTIQNWGPFLASHGIITMTIGANFLNDNHIQRRDALVDAIVSLKNENQRVASPLYGKIDTSSIAVGGFSKGGGGAQLVPFIDSNIKAIVSLYPWLDNPTSFDLNHSVPVIIISGQLDVIAPPSFHADIHYNLTPDSTSKLKYEVAFGNHDAISGPYGGGGEVGIRVISWLQNFLLDDSCYCPITTLSATTSSSYITNVLCDNLILTDSKLETCSFRKLLKITDFLGREVDFKKNETLLYIYDNGTVEKKIILK